jgi:integrase
MQDCIDDCGHGYSTQWAIKNLWGHLDRFAYELDIIEKQYSILTTASPIPETKKDRFTEEQIEQLWQMYSDGVPWVDSVLIYIYSGFRLNELLSMKCEQVDLTEWLFIGGLKSQAGKNRQVPIHSRIQPLVQARVTSDNAYLFTYNGKKVSQTTYYGLWNDIMNRLEADKTVHECRHTFRSRLDSAGANKKCIDMMMGHKSKDVGERTYTHKTIQELREALELVS